MPNYSGVWTLQEHYEAVLEGNWPEIVRSELYAWGGGSGVSAGALGTNDTLDKSSPVQVGGVSFSQIDTGEDISAGISSNNELYTW